MKTQMLFMLGAFFSVGLVSSFPIYEVVTYDYRDFNNEFMDCKKCETVVDLVKKEIAEGDKIVGPLLNLISMVCHDIYGPAAKQCYDITSNTSAFINFINNHTSSYLCHEMHVC
tara:strand:+ start:30 stop:371 length:342 start_codon:yes stop_codon:yes gene_type:complete